MRKLVSPMFRDIEDDIQCGETSVNDNYRLALYSDQPPPSYCLAADPNNPLCQLTGRYQLRLDSQPGVAPRYREISLLVLTRAQGMVMVMVCLSIHSLHVCQV